MYLLRKGPEAAFLNIYMPCLLCLPNWCRWVLPGLPDPTFNEAAVLPIAGMFLFRHSPPWKFSLMDFQVLVLVALMACSEFKNAGFADAQNLMFDMLAAGLLPYVLAKGLIQSGDLRAAFSKRFVACVSFVFVVALYEFKFAYNPYRLLFDPIFRGQGSEWVTTFRYGLPRAAGPYGHAILAGIVFMMAIQFQAWLTGSGLWDRKLRKPLLLTCSTIVGLVLTWVRGPQIGAVIAMPFNALSRSVVPRRRARLLLWCSLAVGIPASLWLISYASVGRAQALNPSQETAAYRKELLDKYVQVAFDHAWLGWGRNRWPKAPGMPSIDNFYLLLALMHGVLATTVLVSILSALIVRLYRNAITNAPLPRKGSSLSFALLGLYAGMAFAIATVYMGENVVPIFFMVTGFTEGYLRAGGDKLLAGEETAKHSAQPVVTRFVY